MSNKEWEVVAHESYVSVGDVVRVTLEGTVVSTYESRDPGYPPRWGGIVIRDSDSRNHEVFPDTDSDDVKVEKKRKNPKLAPGQVWRGDKGFFAVIGTDGRGYKFYGIQTGRSYTPEEFFQYFGPYNELIQESPYA